MLIEFFKAHPSYGPSIFAEAFKHMRPYRWFMGVWSYHPATISDWRPANLCEHYFQHGCASCNVELMGSVADD